MPRKARVATEGGWYHVFNRSNGRKTLYHSEYLHSYFISLLEQISEKYEIQLHENLLNLSRYIHLNPVSARISTTPEEYTWSSYNNYLDPENAPLFLHTSKILDYFISKDEYKQYVELGVDANTKAFFGRKKIPGIFKID